MANSKSENKTEIFTENASVFRHGAKIGFFQMLQLVIGFASGASIAEAVQKTDLHRDTVRDIYAALRDRLSKPRFRKWVQSEYGSAHLTQEQDTTQMDEARAALFHCHENTNCQKRFSAGRRQARVCRSCPVKGYVQSHTGEIDGTEELVDLIDRVRNIYQMFGWNESVNSGTDKRDIFNKRFRHFEVYSTALGSSTYDENGNILSTEDDFLSIRHLAKDLMDDLREEPLR